MRLRLRADAPRTPPGSLWGGRAEAPQAGTVPTSHSDKYQVLTTSSLNAYGQSRAGSRSTLPCTPLVSLHVLARLVDVAVGMGDLHLLPGLRHGHASHAPLVGLGVLTDVHIHRTKDVTAVHIHRTKDATVQCDAVVDRTAATAARHTEAKYVQGEVALGVQGEEALGPQG